MGEETGVQDWRAAREAQIRTACDDGDHARGVTLLLETYAQELLSFLAVRLGDSSHADDAFSMLAEDLWVSLPKFQFRSSVRTWAYTVARHVAARYARTPARKRDKNLTLSKNAPLSQLVEQLRTRTEVYRRTDVKSEVRALREKLPADDQTLLVLRVDRQMAWRDLALVMSSSGDPTVASIDDEALEREAARLRKRFERIKGELKRLAKEAGLLP
ncbi:MAG: sigma-70 family RNA polymerase sigma factor [Myxococcales bacterium]|nr:sigma-70 family RNA polymerase sigma factor [Myxococcales bacterium]